MAQLHVVKARCCRMGIAGRSRGDFSARRAREMERSRQPQQRDDTRHGVHLINPRGMIFHEIRASDMLVCDLKGNVVSGKGELRKVAHHIHSRIHLEASASQVVLHVHPPYTTAFSLVEGGRLDLAHSNDLLFNDRSPTTTR